MNEKVEKTELDILFPKIKVEIGKDIFVNVFPISAEDLPSVIKPFGAIFVKAGMPGMNPSLLAIEAMSEALSILPFCIDRPIKEIPVTAVPDVIIAMLEANVTPESVKKWVLLVQKVTKGMGDKPAA